MITAETGGLYGEKLKGGRRIVPAQKQEQENRGLVGKKKGGSPSRIKKTSGEGRSRSRKKFLG